MNAIQFIQKNGIEKAREVVEGAPERAISAKPSLDFKHFMYGICENAGGAYINLSDLKRLVESVDLLKSNGGYEEAKDTFDFAIKHGMNDLTEFGSRLKQAIADYEQLFGNTETSELETLRNCDTSPNCKKFDEGVK